MKIFSTFFLLVLFSGLSYSSYDPNFALMALKRAYASYCPGPSLVDWSCYWCTPDIAPPKGSVTPINVSSTNIFSYVFREGQVIWIVVRGTQVKSIVDWIHNVDFVLTPLFTGSSLKVHQGFLQDANSMYPDVLNAVKSRLNSCPTCSILIAGHSLGGAISSIFAFQLQKDLGSVSISEWTYGSPRTGNPAFATAHASVVPVSWRVVNKADIVPHLPIKFLDIYHHVSTEVWYPTNYTSYMVCNGSGEDPNCSDSVLITNVDDHLTYFGINLRVGVLNGC